jgi:hypothetical protein
MMVCGRSSGSGSNGPSSVASIKTLQHLWKPIDETFFTVTGCYDQLDPVNRVKSRPFIWLFNSTFVSAINALEGQWGFSSHKKHMWKYIYI